MSGTELKKAGLKVTLPRLKVLEVLGQADPHHMSAEDVYKKLLNSDETIGLATVYRVLTQFESAGIVERHNFDDGHSVYELDNNDALRRKVEYFNDANVDLAIELHLNGGGGNYSTVIAFDSNKQISARALDPGKAIAHAFQAIYPWPSIGLRGQSYFNRTLYFLEKTRMPALILEPGFLDNPAHRKVFDGKAGPLFYAAAVGGALLRLYQS